MATGSGLDAQIGMKTETAVGTKVTVDRFFDFNMADLAFTPSYIEGSGIQAGRKFKSVNQAGIARKAATGKIEIPVMQKGFGWFWKHFIGSVGVANQIGATTAYRQIHTPGDLRGVSFTCQVGKPEADTGIVKPYTYNGCKVTDWDLTFADNANTLCSFTVDAWDEDTATALAAASYSTGNIEWNFSHVTTFKIGGTASTTAALAAPAAPVPTTATTGGTILAGTYQVQVTYVNQWGETVGSATGSVTTTGSTSTITIPSPTASGSATGWYAYVTQAGGSTYTRQQVAGSPTAIGTPLTLIAPPTSTGANPPASNTSASETTIAGATAVSSVVSSLSLAGKNTLEVSRYGLGNAGTKKEQLETDFTSITGTFKAEFNSADFQTDFKAGTSTAIQIDSVGAVIAGANTYLLSVIIPAAKITKAPVTVPGPGLVAVDGEFVVYDPDDGSNPAFQVKIVSTDTVA